MPIDKPQFFRRDLYQSVNLHAPGILHRNSSNPFALAESTRSYYSQLKHSRFDLNILESQDRRTQPVNKSRLLHDTIEDPAHRRFRIAYPHAIKPLYAMVLENEPVSRIQYKEFSSVNLGVPILLGTTILCAYIMRNKFS